MTITHVAPGWRADPGARDLLTFDDWWRLPADWVEPPNFRRGGWSAVSRLTLPGPTGEAETLYVKRQVAQFRRTPATGGRLRPTYFHEFQALSWSPTLPVVDWVCYAERGDQAILVTRAPRGFVPLSVLAGRMPERIWPARWYRWAPPWRCCTGAVFSMAPATRTIFWWTRSLCG